MGVKAKIRSKKKEEGLMSVVVAIKFFPENFDMHFKNSGITLRLEAQIQNENFLFIIKQQTQSFISYSQSSI